EQIKKLGVEKHIKLLGRKTQSEIIKYLNNSDLFLATSITASDGDKEGIPNAIKEAMLMKIPVISTEHSGIPELVIDGLTGYIVPERDIKSLYQKIKFLIDHIDNQESVVNNAYKKVVDEFSITNLNNELEKIYKRVMQ